MSFNHRTDSASRKHKSNEELDQDERIVPSVTVQGRHDRRTFSSKYCPSLRSTLIFLAFVLALTLNGAFTPLVRRGFFCNDSSIYYPVKLDTVSFKALIFISIIIPSIVINLCERDLRNQSSASIHMQIPSKKRNRKISDAIPEEDSEDLLSYDYQSKSGSDSVTPDQDVQDDGSKMTNSSTQTPRDGDIIGHSVSKHSESSGIVPISPLQKFFCGCTATAFLTGIGKITTGRLRPHFMQQCRPTNIDCHSTDNLNKYIEDFKCEGFDYGSRHQNYITTSWPSGHASLVFYCMIYFSIYLYRTLPRIDSYHHKQTWKSSPLIIFSVITGLLSLASYISLTRVSDYHHHPLDVLSGCILGSFVALLWCNFDHSNYQRNSRCEGLGHS